MTTVTSEEGNFRFLRLSPGNYELKFELEGFKTVIRKGIRLFVGKNVTLTMPMETTTIQEEVIVTAKAGVVDTRKTTVGVNISKEMIQSLPTARNPFTVLSLAPGMMVDRVDVGGADSGQQSNFLAGGGSGDDTAWNVDGANITDNSAIGAAPAYLNMNAYEEMQITVGANDIGAQTGGVQLNFVSKRAGNRFAGDFHLHVQDKAWEMKQDLTPYMTTPELRHPGRQPPVPVRRELRRPGRQGPLVLHGLLRHPGHPRPHHRRRRGCHLAGLRLRQDELPVRQHHRRPEPLPRRQEEVGPHRPLLGPAEQRLAVSTRTARAGSTTAPSSRCWAT